MEAAEMGLRERKRRRTRELIAREALVLFDRQGFGETTIPQIAAAADVSPRTVSGYFPHKEDLAFPDADEAFATLQARVMDRSPGVTAVEALREWFGEWLAQADPEEMRIRQRIVREHEGLRAYEHRFRARAQDLLTHAIARDLDAAPTDLEPRMAAAATLAVFDVLDADKVGSPEAAPAIVDRALRFIGAGIGALQE